MNYKNFARCLSAPFNKKQLRIRDARPDRQAGQLPAKSILNLQFAKLVISVICLITILQTVNLAVAGDFSDINVLTGSDLPINDVENYFVNQDPDPVEPGDYVELRFKVENIGYDLAEDITFEIIPKYPFSLAPGESHGLKLGTIDSQQSGKDSYILHYKLKVEDSAPDGEYEIRLKYSIETKGVSVTLQPFSVRVRRVGAVLSIENASTSPGIVIPGQPFTITLTLANKAFTQVKDIRSKVVLEYGNSELPFAPSGSTDEKVFAGLGFGKSQAVSFELLSDVDAENRVYKVPVLVQYSDRTGRNYSIDNIVSVRVGEKKMGALISVDGVQTEPQILVQGKPANLGFSIKNLDEYSIKDIKIKLALMYPITGGGYMELPFSPIESTDERTYRSLEPNTPLVVLFKLLVDSDAQSKVYKVPLIISYSDRLGQNYSLNSILSMRVGSKPDVIIGLDGDVKTPESKAGVMLKVVNKGLDDIKAVYAVLHESGDYQILSEKDVYIGNIEPDDYETADFEIYIKPTSKKSIDVPITITYRDTDNVEYEEKKVFIVPVYSSEELLKMGVIQKSNAPMIVFIVIIAIALYFGYRKYNKYRREKKREQMKEQTREK